MNAEKLQTLRIDRAQRQRSGGAYRAIVILVLLLTGIGAYFAWPKKGDNARVFSGNKQVAFASLLSKQLCG